jgi:hypothetical protein
MRKYKKFEDWFEEVENYGMRLERFHEEFSMVDYVKRERMIEWLQAAWTCAREQHEKI